MLESLGFLVSPPSMIFNSLPSSFQMLDKTIWSFHHKERTILCLSSIFQAHLFLHSLSQRSTNNETVLTVEAHCFKKIFQDCE